MDASTVMIHLPELDPAGRFSHGRCSAPACRRLDRPGPHRLRSIRLPEAHTSSNVDEREASLFHATAHHSLIQGDDPCSLLDGQEHLICWRPLLEFTMHTAPTGSPSPAMMNAPQCWRNPPVSTSWATGGLTGVLCRQVELSKPARTTSGRTRGSAHAYQL